jgi:tripartite-type tricarboxylate transporter receptor subunit TctC
MSLHHIIKATVITLLALAALNATPSFAQYPSKPVRLIVPFPPGGATDAAARELGEGLSKIMGQPFLVENRPGADGGVAAQVVLSAPADGYTLLFASSSMEGIPFVQKAATFTSLNDFTPVSLVCRLAFGLATTPSVPAKSISEFVAYAKANPEKLNYGAGSLSEVLAAAQFMKSTATRMVRVNYKGGAPMMPDLASGQIHVSFGPMTPMLAFARDARINLLATMLDHRTTVMPDLPTMREAGIDGIRGAGGLQAVMAPPKTSPEIADSLNSAIRAVMADPQVRAKFAQRGQEAETTTAASLATLIRGERAVWVDYVTAENIKPE